MSPIASAVAQHEDGVLHLKGVLDSHSAEPLCSEKAGLSAKVVSLERTIGGGIAYDIEVGIDETTWKEKEAADAAELKAKQEADASKAKAEADAAAVKASSDADSKLAAVVASAVAKALAAKDDATASQRTSTDA